MLLIIDNYDSFTFNLFQMVAGQVETVIVKRNDRISLAEIAELNPSGIILSPGPGRPEDAGICVELIKKFASTIPIFGVCLGHQAIAIAFGGKVVQASQIVHGKTTYVFHRRRDIFNNLPLPFAAGRYHSLIVERDSLPKELIVEAESNEGIIMALKHLFFPTYGVQFHPESILTPDGALLMQHFLIECQLKDKGADRC
ncbi:anthranilate synthase component II [Candidatus Riflebacteria bacterium]